MKRRDIPALTLHNGIKIPQIGLGVWQAEEGEEVEQAISTALQAGYRLIDTAAAYGNEAGVGRAVRSSGIPREEIFVTTKVRNSDQGYDQTLRAFNESLDKLGLEYVDLYLIHWPLPAQKKFSVTWTALEKLYADKRIRAIGVSNFKPHHLEALLLTAQVVPMVKQIELHPKLQQRETRDFCAVHHIQVESWSPLMRGGEILRDPLIMSLAEAHGKTPAQIVIRWHLQSGLVVIPKSVHAERIQENLDVLDFQLTEDEFRRINDLDADTRIGPDPDTANFA